MDYKENIINRNILSQIHVALEEARKLGATRRKHARVKEEQKAKEDQERKDALKALAKAKAEEIFPMIPGIIHDSSLRGLKKAVVYSQDGNWSPYDQLVVEALLYLCAGSGIHLLLDKQPASGRDMCDNLLTGDEGILFISLP